MDYEILKINPEDDNKYTAPHEKFGLKEDLLSKGIRNVAGSAAGLAHLGARIPGYIGDAGEYAANQPEGTYAKSVSKVIKSVPGVEQFGDLLRSSGKGVDKISKMIKSVFPKGYLDPQTNNEELVQTFLPVIARAAGTSGLSAVELLKNPSSAWKFIKDLGFMATSMGVGKAAATGADALGGGPIAQSLANIGAQGGVNALSKSNIIKDFAPQKKSQYKTSRSAEEPTKIKPKLKEPFKEQKVTQFLEEDGVRTGLRSESSKKAIEFANKKGVADVEAKNLKAQKHVDLKNEKSLNDAIKKAGYDPNKDKFEDFGRVKQKDLRESAINILRREHEESGTPAGRNNTELLLNRFRTDKENISKSITQIGKQKYSNYQLQEDLKSKGVDPSRNKRLNTLFPDKRMVNKDGTVNKSNLRSLYKDDLSVNETYDLKKRIAKIKHSGSEGSRSEGIKQLEGATQKAASNTAGQYPLQESALRKGDAIHQLLLKADKSGWIERVKLEPNLFKKAWKAIPLSPNAEIIGHFASKLPKEGLQHYLKYAKAAAMKDYPALKRYAQKLEPYLDKEDEDFEVLNIV